MVIFSVVVVAIMVVFAMIGVIDQLFLKNKWGIGPEFKRGMELMGLFVL